MRRIIVGTRLEATPEAVWALLQDASLLSELTRFPRVALIGKGEIWEGATIALTVGFGPVRLPWVSRVGVMGPKAFCDQGVRLPFPFTRFCHVHRVEQQHGRTLLIDDVTFDSWLPNILVEWFVLRPMFRTRKCAFEKILIT